MTKYQDAYWKLFAAESPECVAMAMDIIATDDRVTIAKTDERCGGVYEWAVFPLSDGGMWLGAEPTKAKALALCKKMGWKVVEP